MRKKKQVVKKQSASSGFDSLISSYTLALEDNSNSIAEMLEILSSKKLSEKELKAIKGIKRDLNRINRDLDTLGDE